MITLNRYKFLIVLLILLFTLGSCNNDEVKNDLKNISEKNESANTYNIVVPESEIVEDIEDTFDRSDYSDSNLNYYRINASLDDTNGVIKGNQVVKYTNTEDRDLNELYFNIHPNEYNVDEIEGDSGFLNIRSVRINGIPASYSVDTFETILKVESEEGFKLGETYLIQLTFITALPAIGDRLGFAEDIYNLGNWYPILCVYDEDGWNLDPFYYYGDPFYSEVSNYDVNMEVPDKFIVAGSGYVTDIYHNDGKKIYSFVGDRMRDFALVMSDRFDILSTNVNDTTVFLYYPKDLEKEALMDKSLDISAKSIRLFSDVIGTYPYKTYSVVLTEFTTGMEYPGLVYISLNYYHRGLSDIQKVIVHETGHQWFYGIIGNDQIESGWIDEGLTRFVEMYYHLKTINENSYTAYIVKLKGELRGFGGVESVNIKKHPKDVKSGKEYKYMAYSKPALMFNELYQTYGEEKFIEYLRALYDGHKFEILKEDGIRKAAESVFEKDLSDFFDYWLD